MDSRIDLFAVLLLVVGLANLAGGNNEIKCYSCSTKDTPSCLHPEKHKLELNVCNSDSMKVIKDHVRNVDDEMTDLFDAQVPKNVKFNCMKKITKVGDTDFVIRGCQPETTDERLDICKNLMQKKFSKSNVTHCSLCDRDGCNTAPSLNRLYVDVFAIVFVALLSTI